MKTKLEFEVETLREILKASIECFDEIERTPSGLTSYGRGYRDRSRDVLAIVDRILEEVNT